MVPKINNRGRSFKGVMAYLAHDKNASTSERVAWSETGNMHTDDLEKAAKVMAWTDKNADFLKRDFGGSSAGRKSEAGAVYHYSLSWAIGEEPDKDHMREQAHTTLEKLGLSSHQFVIVAHNDTDHAHVHIVANLTNLETGKRYTPSFDKRELQAWALTYEREHGFHCHMREENARKRERGEYAKYRTEKQDYSIRVTRAYEASDNGSSFVHALEAEDLKLAAARRGNGFVLVDEKGDIQKLARQLDIEEKGKAKTEAINAKLADLDRSTLPDADALAKGIKDKLDREKEYEQAGSIDREAEEAQQQNDLLDAADEAAALQAKFEREKSREAKRQAAKERRKTQTRIEILKDAKTRRMDLKEKQRLEQKRLEKQLREKDSPEEAAHRARWQKLINADQDRIDDFTEKLNQKGVAGMVYRVLHGREARKDISALEKNIGYEKMRLAEGVGGLSREDRRDLKSLRSRHVVQRKALEDQITEELNAAEQSIEVTDKAQARLPSSAGESEKKTKVRDPFNAIDDRAQQTRGPDLER